MLEISNLTSGYGGIVAVRKVSLTVEDGGITALIGSNGAGKTSLLNTISGFVSAREGSVKFNGREILGERPHRVARLGILHVPEGRQVLAPLSVLENLRLGRLAASTPTTVAETLDKVFELFPRLQERSSQLAGSLSGGEQQMLAIGRALMGEPKLVLLDEPSLGLAPKIIDLVFEVLERLNQRGLSILLVEQNARRALEVARSAYVIERGRIVRSGSAQELLHDQEIEALYFGGDVKHSDSSATASVSPT